MGRIAWAGLFAGAMGILEAICVIYLRRLLLPAGTDTDGIADVLSTMHIEHVREAATLVMLLSAAWLAGDRARSRTAFFFLMFGVWDIVYYAGLRIFAGWPPSLLTWDCLFLSPVPWYAPVLAPILVSAYFIGACALLIRLEAGDRPLRLTRPVLLLQLAGFCVWYASFVRRSGSIASDGYGAAAYDWPLFGIGGLLCLGGLALCLAKRRPAG